MPTLTIEGKRVKVDDAFMQLSPEEQASTVEEIAGQLGIVAGGESAAYKEGLNNLSGLTQAAAQRDGGSIGRSVDSFMRGAADMMTLGMADEGAASLMTLPGDFRGLQRNLLRQRVAQEQRDNKDPISSTAGRVAGGLASGVGMAKGGLSLVGRLAPTAGLGAKVAAGAAEGAAYGGAYGFGSGEGLGDRAAQAAGGAAMGGLIGGAVPAVASGVKAATKPIRDAVSARMNPGGYASQKIAERLGASNMSVSEAMRKARPGETLADVGGDSARTLLRTAANIPGKGKDAISKTVTIRQLGQGDRLRNIISKTFADPDAFEAQKAALFKTQAETAGPMYQRALAKKGVWNDRLDQFLKDPVVARATAQGVKIQRLESLAENVPFNPKDMAITAFNEAGDPIISGVPNMRTINVIKKGFDAMLEGARHPITGRLTEEGRAVDAVRRAFLNEVDKINPAYATARKSYATFMQVNDAMELGKSAFTKTPAFLFEKVSKMTPVERVAARSGAAEAMRKAIDEAGWTNNAVLKIFGNRQKVSALRTLFGSSKDFATFRSAIFSEMRKRKTYEAVKGNSTTAAQMADMMDAGGLAGQAETVKTAATQGFTAAALQFVGSRLRMLGGLTPEVADQIGRKLLTSNPEKLQQVVQALSAIESRNLSSASRQVAVNRLVSDALRSATLAPALSSQR